MSDSTQITPDNVMDIVRRLAEILNQKQYKLTTTQPTITNSIAWIKTRISFEFDGLHAATLSGMNPQSPTYPIWQVKIYATDSPKYKDNPTITFKKSTVSINFTDDFNRKCTYIFSYES